MRIYGYLYFFSAVIDFNKSLHQSELVLLRAFLFDDSFSFPSSFTLQMHKQRSPQIKQEGIKSWPT